MKILKNSSGRLYEELLLERGLCPGVETPVTPDEPHVLDVGGGVEAAIANLLIILENLEFANHRHSTVLTCR